jgi:hypothetical protein
MRYILQLYVFSFGIAFRDRAGAFGLFKSSAKIKKLLQYVLLGPAAPSRHYMYLMLWMGRAYHATKLSLGGLFYFLNPDTYVQYYSFRNFMQSNEDKNMQVCKYCLLFYQ